MDNHPIALQFQLFDPPVHIIGPFILGIPCVLLMVLYVMSIAISNRFYKKWPFYRMGLWIAGVSCAIFSGLLANHSHMDFKAHMMGHLLLGMVAPLFMVLAAPVTLLLRTLPVKHARKVSRILKKRFFRYITDPVTASVLNIGGLWILYTTDLFPTMQQNFIVHTVVHGHVLLAGFIFTSSFISIDSSPHRPGFLYRAVVLVFALAGHGILSKFLYAHPPAGVPELQAQTGGLLMYYAGDLIDLVIIVVLCYQWYKNVRPNSVESGIFITSSKL
ncbi:cytochrome c oxidase assembly protein [Neobacillus sp. Marseille-QA0830]